MWLIILLIIIVLFAVLLMSSLSLTLNINEKVDFKVSFLGICVFNLNSAKEKKKHSVTKKKSSEDKSGFAPLLKEYANSKSKKELILELLSLFKELCIKFKKVLKHVRIKKLEADLSVASEDAAKTAILYGNACTIIYSITAMLKSASNFDHNKIKVFADFTSEKMSFKLQSNIKVRICFLILFAISFVYSVIKIKLGEVKNG